MVIAKNSDRTQNTPLVNNQIKYTMPATGNPISSKTSNKDILASLPKKYAAIKKIAAATYNSFAAFFTVCGIGAVSI